MDVLEKLALAGIVPVVVLEAFADALPTAKAMLAGDSRVCAQGGHRRTQ